MTNGYGGHVINTQQATSMSGQPNATLELRRMQLAAHFALISSLVIANLCRPFTLSLRLTWCSK